MLVISRVLRSRKPFPAEILSGVVFLFCPAHQYDTALHSFVVSSRDLGTNLKPVHTITKELAHLGCTHFVSKRFITTFTMSPDHLLQKHEHIPQSLWCLAFSKELKYARLFYVCAPWKTSPYLNLSFPVGEIRLLIGFFSRRLVTKHIE